MDLLEGGLEGKGGERGGIEAWGRVGRLNRQYRRVVWDLVRVEVSGTIRNLGGRLGVSESRNWFGLETTNSLSAVL